jgi:hypothetical protein
LLLHFQQDLRELVRSLEQDEEGLETTQHRIVDAELHWLRLQLPADLPTSPLHAQHEHVRRIETLPQ